MADPIIVEAWIEIEETGRGKLGVRYDPDTGAENLGCFYPEKHNINAKKFVGLSLTEACGEFNKIVYRTK